MPAFGSKRLNSNRPRPGSHPERGHFTPEGEDHMTTWPSREQWAIEHRTFYNDDDIRVSAKAVDYATPEEIAAAVAEGRVAEVVEI
jgi:hypothetical protein